MPENREEALSESVNVFTYGSLMYAPVWSQIVSGRYASVDGIVSGYRRFAVLGEDYPGVVQAGADAAVSGRVYLGVNAADLRRLDEFEGEYYFRDVCVMSTPQGEVEVQLYVIKPEYSRVLSAENWNQKAFEQAGLQRFLERYSGFSRV
ncbi:gamma-glutamylcyclotransferase family protein [Thiomicrorhabdus cannonii]|uniref:gamma-glutamylcyclotransferase family protein n=1 Tax=Thiomicrorhabdus cannonii TaxID=2748011 RepID=UPI0015BD7C19|nr:gamma-glutamylcyclotransferase family protein [Thiomicrorhabdus cannonii]